MIFRRRNQGLGSARVSRVGFGVSPKQFFQESPRWRGRHRQHARRVRYPDHAQ